MPTKLPQLNEKLIAKVLKHISKDVRRLNQDTYGMLKSAPIEDRGIAYDKWAPCNTQACFAGWTVLLSTPARLRKTLFDKRTGTMKGLPWIRAKELLGLTEDESDFLFKITCHPGPRRDLQIVKSRLEQIREGRAND